MTLLLVQKYSMLNKIAEELPSSLALSWQQGFDYGIQDVDYYPEPALAPVIIVGAGQVGVRAATELSKRGQHVLLFNAESSKPYSRVRLTPLLAGEIEEEGIYLDNNYPVSGRVESHHGVSVVAIDRVRRTVTVSNHEIIHYSDLILAVGSYAHVPPITGSNLAGVFTFRDFEDACALMKRAKSARSVVVIGGGLLGLEAARGMCGANTQVTVIEHEGRLMPRQLDERAGDALKVSIQRLGVKVITGEGVERIDGTSAVERVTLRNADTIKADTVIICTGVRANIQLAKEAGLAADRGILVNDVLKTSDPNIYAIGECAQHKNVVYGLVGPGYEQAVIAVRNITSDACHYTGTLSASKLKVMGADVFSIGNVESIAEESEVTSHIFEDQANLIYRRLFIRRNALVAALGVGAWPESNQVQDLVAQQQTIPSRQLKRFAKTGRLFKARKTQVGDWPDSAIVCNCTATPKSAIQACGSLQEVQITTSATTVCGTCVPLVNQLVNGQPSTAQPVKWWRIFLVVSLLTGIVSLTVLIMPRIPVSSTFSSRDVLRYLWFDNTWKQVSGYTLLGLTMASAVIGLRKRIKWLARFGSYDAWRLLHLLTGVVCAIALVLHTGFRLGSNLNFLLMMCFIATLVFGAIAGLTTASEHELRRHNLIEENQSPRTILVWVHLLVLWPLPMLLAIHILVVYSF